MGASTSLAKPDFGAKGKSAGAEKRSDLKTEHKEEKKESSFDPLDDPKLFINRELSWLGVNNRILEEAEPGSGHPLLERIKFLAICGSNMDEFFMVRAAAIRKQVLKGALKAPPDGMTPLEQLAAIRTACLPLLERYTKCWHDSILPELAKAGIHICKISDLDTERKAALRDYFQHNMFPTLTPLAMDLAHPFPFISNLSLNLAVVVHDPQNRDMYARVKIPIGLFQRLVKMPDAGDGGAQCAGPAQKPVRRINFVLLEDLVASNLDLLFPGMKVIAAYPFRITRNAEIEIAVDEASDLLTAIEESMETRRIGFPIRLEVDKSMPQNLIDLFMKNLELECDMVYQFDGPLGLVNLWQMLEIDAPDLKDKPFIPYTPPKMTEHDEIFAAVAKKDHVFYHPYDSFNVIVNMLRQAANDPNVLAIKICLYRIDKKSPVIDALIEARQNGKDVAALIELKAKFDEENNITWARMLEQAGVHVVYGLVDLKVHAKLLLIVRKEGDRIVRYSHLSSGNYNAVTARIYGDIGYLTANEDIGEDVSNLFNSLTGYRHEYTYKRLLVAPRSIRYEMLRRIEREIGVHKKYGGGYIALKLNGLVEKEIIKALYRASQSGVKIDLNVRGLCCLRPGIKGVSDNISETSIISRFLEHARIYYFRNGGDEEVILGSSDMMPRNLDRRVEVLFPVPDPAIKKAIIEHMLNVHLKDNVKTRRMLPDGKYEFFVPSDESKRFNSQEWLIANRGIWHGAKQ